jgi:hypothetical protein
VPARHCLLGRHPSLVHTLCTHSLAVLQHAGLQGLGQGSRRSPYANNTISQVETSTLIWCTPVPVCTELRLENMHGWHDSPSADYSEPTKSSSTDVSPTDQFHERPTHMWATSAARHLLVCIKQRCFMYMPWSHMSSTVEQRRKSSAADTREHTHCIRPIHLCNQVAAGRAQAPRCS